jgi:hypothetical protein
LRSFKICTRHQIAWAEKIKYKNVEGLVKRMGEERKLYWVFMGSPEE